MFPHMNSQWKGLNIGESLLINADLIDWEKNQHYAYT